MNVTGIPQSKIRNMYTSSSDSEKEHLSKMAAVRGTARHTYNVEDRLGQGATGNVFKGLSKPTLGILMMVMTGGRPRVENIVKLPCSMETGGEFHALKIFEPFAIKDISREITALQKLKHENIISFIGVEEELLSKQVVVVMEFCEGGSLASFLNKPDNYFGLPETEFLLLMKHLVSGMEHLRSHGFVHRDIKPGNILRCINKDGSSMFKLSDFGTARPLEDDEFFKSLVGTQEYLHPDMFNAAFISGKKSLNFPHSVDLWSLGVTLYHAAAGEVPFYPYDRRNDHVTMYEMITKKPVGVIGATQNKPNGKIEWIYDMPDTCQLTRGLQKLLVTMLVALFERDPSRVWTFEHFFQETQKIISCEVVTVLALYPHQSPFDAVYMPQLKCVRELKKALCRQWGMAGVTLEETLYGESRLSDWLQDDDQLFDLPSTDWSTPLVVLPSMLPRSEGDTVPELSMSRIASEGLTFSGSMGQIYDVQKAREMCGIVSLIERRATAMALFQQHLLKLRHRLRFQLRREMQEAEKLFHMLTELFDVISGTADMSTWSQQEKNNFGQVKQKMAKVSDSLQQASSTIRLPFEDNQWNFDGKQCTQQAKRAKDEVLGWFRDIKERKKVTSKNRYSTQHAEKCLAASRQHLEDAYKQAVNLWSDQCFQKTGLLRDSFLDWYRSYIGASRGLQSCQEDLRAIVSLVMQLFKSCVNRCQGLKEKTKKISKSWLEPTLKHPVDRSQLVDFRNMVQEITNDMEAPEVFGLPTT